MKATEISKYIPGAQAKITTYQKKIIATNTKLPNTKPPNSENTKTQQNKITYGTEYKL